MRPISFVARDGALHPEALDDVQAFKDRFGDGEIVESEVRPIQSAGQRAFWAMVTPSWKAIGKIRWERADDMADALKLALGHKHMGETVSGSPYWIADSISTVKDWTDFLRRVKAALIEMGVDEELLRDPDLPPPHTEIPDRGQEPQERPVTGDTPTPSECFEKFLLIAGSKDFEDKQRHLRTIDTLETQWNEALPGEPDFVRRCANSARMVIAGSLKLADMKKLLKEQVPQ